MTIWCRFGWHAWEKWYVIEEGAIISYGFLGKQDPLQAGRYKITERVCAECQRRQTQTLRAEL